MVPICCTHRCCWAASFCTGSFICPATRLQGPCLARSSASPVEKLVESVYLQWEEEAKIRGLFDLDPMPVHWTLTEHNVSDHNRHISPDPLIMDGSSDRIDELTEQFLTLGVHGW